MKNIAAIIRSDFQRARRNVISAVVLVGVVLIPSFFAWFNVLASWNPFANVRNIQVAVANADEGYRSDLFPMTINVGETVMSSLHANDDIDWVFVSEEKAIDGTKAGHYYAALVLPPDFSKHMMTFLAPEVKPAEVDFYINEKKNALSPIILGEASTDVSVQINQTFVKTLDNVGLALVSSIATHLESADVQEVVGRLEERVGILSTQLDSAATTAEMFAGLIGSSIPLVESAASLASSAATAAKSSPGVVGSGVDRPDALEQVLAKVRTQLTDALAASEDGHRRLAAELDRLLESLQGPSEQLTARVAGITEKIEEQLGAFTTIRDRLRAQAENPEVDPAVADALGLLADRLDVVIDRENAVLERLGELERDVEAGVGDLEADRNAIVSDIEDVEAAIGQARTQFSDDLVPKLDRLLGTLGGIRGDIAGVGHDLERILEDLSGSGESLVSGLTGAQSGVERLADDFRGVASRLDELHQALTGAAESGDLDEVIDLIGSDPAALAGHLTTPVGLETIPVFPVANFGSQMTPLYSVLGLWVGALLLAVLIRTDVERELLPKLATPLKPWQEYFGRFGLLAVLSLLQATLLYVGLIGFVGVRPAYPLLLILAGWVMSLVFTLITYTLVLAFGPAGKAIGVVLLVVQISTGGGAYPLSVLPQWFQNASPFVPVSHATTAVRAAIAGIFEADYWIALGWLLVFVLPTLLIGLVLRLPLRKMNSGLEEAMAATRVMGGPPGPATSSAGGDDSADLDAPEARPRQ